MPTAHILDGKAVAAHIKHQLAREVQELIAAGIQPGLAVVLAGGDPASRVYVGNKKKACAQLGIHSAEYLLSGDVAQDELIALIRRLNRDPGIHGILVQLPLPAHLSVRAVIDAIAPEKDVDCFTPQNVGRVVSGGYRLAPCTPAGCMELLKRGGVALEGKHCVVLGRSNIVGKPMALLLLEQNATVTVCHSRTQNLADLTRQADVLIAAVGKPRFVTADMVAKGAAVVDVGIHRGPDGSLCGDVDFGAVSQKASVITPVPGGVGPMTIAMLMKNTVAAARQALDSAQKL